MAIGDISVTVTPDATDFWRSFRARTSGQAEAEGRRQGDEFRRGMQESASRGSVRVRADVDTSRARAEIKSLQDQGQKSGGGLLQALLPLAPALAPLTGAAIAAGSGLAVLGASGLLAFKGIQSAMKGTTQLGGEAAASISVVKGALSTLERTAARNALPGLQAAVLAVNTELPALRRTVAQEASVAGEVAAHLVRGIAAGFTTFAPVITAVGSDVDTLAAHFEAFASGPGGARFAKTMASDYAQVKPVIESVVRAVVDIARAGSQGGLGVLHILGEVSNIIDSFPTPVLTAIVDGFLAFRAVSIASTAIAGVQRAFAGVKSAAASVAAATQLASTQRIAAEAKTAAATTEAEAVAAEAMLATANAARNELLAVATSRGELSASQEAQMQVQLGIADREIASYEAVAAAARASALQQAAAAEEAAGAAAATRSTAGAGSLVGVLGKTLGPIALVATALPLLSGLFGDNGQSAQEAASQVDSYTTALINSKGAIDGTVRSQVASNLATKGAYEYALKAGISQSDLTDAVLSGGSALNKADTALAGYSFRTTKSYTEGYKFIDVLSQQNKEFQKGAQNAADQAAANDSATAAVRAHAAALHTDVASYQAATDAAAKSTDKTQEQTVAFQLENDAASLLSQALKTLAGQNLDVATAQTSFAQSTNTAAAALKKGKDAIKGHSDAALADQQAIQGTVSSARSLADAVGKQTGSSAKAAASYRHSRDALLSQLKAQGVLTPAVRKYINTLFDVKGVSDYLSKHPTKLDADKKAADAKLRSLQTEIDNIRQGRIPALTLNSIEAENQISRIQGMIDALHGKTVVITTITSDGQSVSVGNGGRGFGLATGGPVHGPGSGTSDSIPAWLSNGEYVVNAKATAKHRHLLDSINKGAHGFAAGGPVGNAQQIASALRSAFGLSRNQIAGFLGNFQVESGFNPRAYNARENAHGIAQWEGSRWTALQQFARRMGVQATSMAAQTGFLVKELRGSGIVSQVKRMADPARVAAYVDAHYERSAGTTRGARVAAARAIAASGVAAAGGGITHDGKDWIFNGQRYASQRAAENAQARASASASKKQVQSTNALVPDAHSIFGALSGSVGDMRKAVAAFIKDFKAAGATTRQIARATADDARLVANQQKLVAARSKLANVTQYSDSIRSTLTGTFDPTHFGSVADLISGYQGQTGQNNAYTKEVNALRKRAGKDGSALGLINTLAASGQTSSLEALYSGSARDLTNAGKAYKGYNTSVQSGVDAASTAKYGETQTQATKDVDRLVANSDKLIATIASLGATVARSHGRSGKHVEQQLDAFATQLETLVRHGRA